MKREKKKTEAEKSEKKSGSVSGKENLYFFPDLGPDGIYIGEKNGKISRIEFPEQKQEADQMKRRKTSASPEPALKKPISALGASVKGEKASSAKNAASLPQAVEEAEGQLKEYFEGKRTAFSLPLLPEGTAFQQKVWKALETIPYGETRSYKEIAELAGCPQGFRAVGMANNRNPISIVIPCHRVIGADGGLVGYGGGLHLKKQLLDLEQRTKARREDKKT